MALLDSRRDPEGSRRESYRAIPVAEVGNRGIASRSKGFKRGAAAMYFRQWRERLHCRAQTDPLMEWWPRPEQTVVPLLHHGVALAGAPLELRSIKHRDVAALIVDDAGSMQTPGRLRDPTCFARSRDVSEQRSAGVEGHQ
jgi:hypothetical protein